MAGPRYDLPLPRDYQDEEKYVQDLLHFMTTCKLFQVLVGGVHVLDFFVNEPDLYEQIIDEDWRAWFAEHEIDDLIDFFLRDDLDGCSSSESGARAGAEEKSGQPPRSLIEYIRQVRSLTLDRTPLSSRSQGPHPQSPMPRHLSLGMSSKKTHEVSHLAELIDTLIADLKRTSNTEITHVVDFGAGQGYLGRVLASPPNNYHVIAVEGRSHNVENSQWLDVGARLAPKEEAWRNKKAFKSSQEAKRRSEMMRVEGTEAAIFARAGNDAVKEDGENLVGRRSRRPPRKRPLCGDRNTKANGTVWHVERQLEDGDLSDVVRDLQSAPASKGDAVNGADHLLQHDNLDLLPMESSIPPHRTKNPQLLVTSLHSCGNLTHHALRSLALNPSVRAVAIVGCCYNLTTSREPLPPPTPHTAPSTHELDFSELMTSLSPEEALKSRRESPKHHDPLPSLPNPNPPRPPGIRTDPTPDPHGFPMSQLLHSYPNPNVTEPCGITLTTTARMLAVQAPLNWGPDGSRAFFTRHFYRALLQRVFVDKGVIDPPSSSLSSSFPTSAPSQPFLPPQGHGHRQGHSAAGLSAPSGTTIPHSTTPIIIGSLGRKPYVSFPTYARAALAKLKLYNTQPSSFYTTMDAVSNAEFEEYERVYKKRKKELSVVWTLMAFSAGLVEAVVVVDRWVWLREEMERGARQEKAREEKREKSEGKENGEGEGGRQMDGEERDKVTRAWVEPLWEYGVSPRNLVVVGVKG